METIDKSHLDLQPLDDTTGSAYFCCCFFSFFIRASAGLEEGRILPSFFSAREKECVGLPEFLIGH